MELFEQLAADSSTMIGLRSNVAVSFLTGKKMPGDNSPYFLGDVPMGTMLNVEGKYIHVPLMQPEPVVAGTGTGIVVESAAISANVRTGRKGVAKFDWMTKFYHKDILESEKRLQNRKKRKEKIAWLQQLNAATIEAEMRAWDEMICGPSTATATANRVASILALLLNNDFGGLSRADVANVNLTPVTNTSAAVALKDIRDMRDEIMDRRATRVVAFCSSNTYSLIAAKVEAVAGHNATQLKDTTVKYSGSYFVYSDIHFVRCSKLPANHVILLDPEVWKVYAEDGQICRQDTEWERQTSHLALNRALYSSTGALICTNPEQNGVFSAMTS